MLKEFTPQNPTTQWRKRINRNPAVSLKVYDRMKRDDFFNFGITTEELATRLLSLTLSGTLKSYLNS